MPKWCEEAHAAIRVLLVKGFKVNAITRYSDYKKFNVETLATVAKPKGAEDSATLSPEDRRSGAR